MQLPLEFSRRRQQRGETTVWIPPFSLCFSTISMSAWRMILAQDKTLNIGNHTEQWLKKAEVTRISRVVQVDEVCSHQTANLHFFTKEKENGHQTQVFSHTRLATANDKCFWKTQLMLKFSMAYHSKCSRWFIGSVTIDQVRLIKLFCIVYALGTRYLGNFFQNSRAVAYRFLRYARYR